MTFKGVYITEKNHFKFQPALGRKNAMHGCCRVYSHEICFYRGINSGEVRGIFNECWEFTLVNRVQLMFAGSQYLRLAVAAVTRENAAC